MTFYMNRITRQKRIRITLRIHSIIVHYVHIEISQPIELTRLRGLKVFERFLIKIDVKITTLIWQTTPQRTWWCKEYFWKKVSKTENINPIQNKRNKRLINPFQKPYISHNFTDGHWIRPTGFQGLYFLSSWISQ